MRCSSVAALNFVGNYGLLQLSTASFGKNGNYFQPVPRTTANADGTSTSTIPGPVTIEEKVQEKNNVKARSILLMELPKYLLIFSQYKDAKTFFEAILVTNEVNTPNIQVSTASTPVTTASLHDNTANLNDATVYAFLANQPNGSQLVHEYLEQIHEDDLEEIDLKWQLALLSMRARREYRSPMHQESRPTNQDSSRKTVNVEETSSKALVAIDTQRYSMTKLVLALVLKKYEALKTQYDKLRIEFNKSKCDLATYKRGLASVEEQLVFYKKNEVMFCDQFAVLKRDASFRDSKINALNAYIENLKKEKESNKIKIDNFENAFKSLEKLIGSQITDNSRKGLVFESYNVIAPPPTGLFSPLTIDLSNSGLKEFQQPEFEGYGLKCSVSHLDEDSFKRLRSTYTLVLTKKTTDAPIIEEWVPDSDEDESEAMESENVQPRKVSQNPKNNRTNWNEKKTQKLGVGFQVTKKASFVCGSFNHLIKDSAVPVSTARPINTAAPKPFVNVAKPRPNDFQKSHSLSRRPFYQHTTLKNKNLNNKVNTAKVDSVNTAKGKRVTSAVEKQGINGDPLVSHRCVTGKNSVLFTESECLILSPEFKLPDESLTCLFANATNDESKMWHRRLGHINFKTINKLVKGNLVRGLPSKIFENDHSCVACQKGKQHKVTLVTDDYSRFSLVFFLAKKDETCGILKDFITGIENQLDHKVKIIRCNNGTEFKTYEMNQFCEIKGIKREFSNARTPQQNGVAERKNRTLIEAARTMLADSLLPITFWAEAVNTACHVQNRVLVTKPHNKTPCELLIGRTPIICFMRPFGYPVTILNTLDHLGKFNGKADEGFLVGYSINSKAFRVFNSRTRKVEENLHVNFLENKPNVAGIGPTWLFDIDSLTNSMNYQPRIT
ncbi:putative ribonuclease H-like domain-containing protein [Tanacetum coccineum]|uniref:Ribonuclease H-like domain-containing protein n=1 Tax=Tanacetum coccineum TaxID=301880 RepID=A0ABQ5IRX3_9ASTR